MNERTFVWHGGVVITPVRGRSVLVFRQGKGETVRGFKGTGKSGTKCSVPLGFSYSERVRVKGRWSFKWKVLGRKRVVVVWSLETFSGN